MLEINIFATLIIYINDWLLSYCVSAFKVIYSGIANTEIVAWIVACFNVTVWF